MKVVLTRISIGMIMLTALSGCAGKAPELPGSQPLTAQEYAQYGNLSCSEIMQHYYQASEGLRQLEDKNQKQHNHNQGTAYIAGFFPPIYMFTSPNKGIDEQIHDLVRSRDKLGKTYGMKGCKG